MKLFASDIDNTLIPQDKQAANPGLAELADFLANQPGLKTAFISGRNLALTREVIAGHNLFQPDFLATDVGTTIYEFRNGDWDKSTEYASYLASSGYNRETIEAKLHDVFGLKLQEKEFQSEFKLSYYLDLDNKPGEIVSGIKHQLEDVPAKVVYSVDKAKSVGLVDILPEASGKAGALDFLAQLAGAKREEVVYAGDSGNDLDIFEAGFSGILVGNASVYLKERVDQGSSNIYVAKNEFAQGVLEGLRFFTGSR